MPAMRLFLHWQAASVQLVATVGVRPLLRTPIERVKTNERLNKIRIRSANGTPTDPISDLLSKCLPSQLNTGSLQANGK